MKVEIKNIFYSIKWKITGLILILVTSIISIIGIIVEKQQTNLLLQTMVNSVMREAQSIVYLDSRAMIADDDLVILDSLKNLNTLDGFTYARVISGNNKVTIVESYDKRIKLDSQKTLETTWRKELKPIWNNVTYEKRNNISKIDIINPVNKGTELFLFHAPIYHPFLTKKPQLMGLVQIAFSNEFINQKIADNRITLIILGIIFWIISFALSLILGTIITRPIKLLSEGAMIVGQGNLQHKLPHIGKDELGELADQFNAMTSNLLEAEQVKKDHIVLNEQVKQAQEIQEGMNPINFFNTDEYEIKGFTRAAKGVGGDYFDIYEMPDKKVAVLISDVSGKSISASLVMVIIKTVVVMYFKIFKKFRGDIIGKSINTVICGESHIDKFATFFFLIYDPKTREIEFTNGGHGPLLVYRNKQNVCTLSKLPGLPIGVDEDSEYSLAKIKMESGDIVILFTDGINEARNPNKDEYSLIQITNKLIEYSKENAEIITQNIVRDLDQFINNAPQHDDMTLVVFKVK